MKKNLLFLAWILTGLISTTSVFAQVTAYQPDDLEVCGDGGFGVFDLTLTEPEIIGGQDPTNLLVRFYLTQVDANNDTNPLANPESYFNITNPQTIFARLEDSSNGDYEITTFEIYVSEIPVINTPTPIYVCDDDNDGFAEFILFDKINEIIGGSNPEVVVSFHYIQADAENGVNSLPDPYSNEIPFNQTVFVRVENPSTGCFSLTTLDLVVLESPEINSVDDIILFDENDDGLEIFDLTIRASQILDGQSADITYYISQSDAIANINPIANPTSYINSSNPQIIYYRLENVNTCYSVGSFILILMDVFIDENPDDLYVNEGDDDGFAIFDLTINEAQMLGDQDPLIALFTYHTSLEDATNGENSIATPNAYQNLTNPQTIFVRLSNSNTGSYVLTNFEIETDGALVVSDNFYANLKLFPNPTSGILHIQSDQLTETVAVKLYNLQGQVVLLDHKAPSNGTISLDLSSMNTGIYFIKMVSEGVSVVKKIVKQ